MQKTSSTPRQKYDYIYIYTYTHDSCTGLRYFDNLAGQLGKLPGQWYLFDDVLQIAETSLSECTVKHDTTSR